MCHPFAEAVVRESEMAFREGIAWVRAGKIGERRKRERVQGSNAWLDPLRALLAWRFEVAKLLQHIALLLSGQPGGCPVAISSMP